jgi:hypothetical protein
MLAVDEEGSDIQDLFLDFGFDLVDDFPAADGMKVDELIQNGR